MPRTAAKAPCRVVMQGTPAAAAAVRMSEPSVRGARPKGVLTDQVHLPGPDQLGDVVLALGDLAPPPRPGIPARCRTPAVPLVASNRNPEVRQALGGSTIARLSRLATLHEDRSDAGRAWPAATIAFASATPASSSIPMTSPVDFISGPRTVSTPGNRPKGRTAALTAAYGRCR